MGQYYYVCNVDKKQYLDPHDFGDGLKLMEFGLSARGTLAGLAILLANSNGRGGGDLRADSPHAQMVGSWAGDRLVVCGDYSDENDVCGNLWHDIGSENSEWENVSSKTMGALLEDRWVRADFVEIEDDDNGYAKYLIEERKNIWKKARPGEPWPESRP
jgi:hypothetical protein